MVFKMKGMQLTTVILVIMFLILPIITITSGKLSVENEITLTTHTSIRINSDSDFTSLNGVSSGIGTIGDPFIIENWEIDGTGYGCGIYIGNTTKYVEIRNCEIYDANSHNVQYYYDAGICLYNIENGTISNNTLYNNRYGIYLSTTSNYNNIITNNISNSISHGIYASNSDNILIDNNSVINTGNTGIYITNSDDTTVKNNTINVTGYRGIFSTLVHRHKVINNYIYNTGVDAIYQTYAINTIIDNNYLDVVDEGIGVSIGCFDIIISNNIIQHHVWEGIYVYTVDNATINNNYVTGGTSIAVCTSSTNIIVKYNTVYDSNIGIGFLYGSSNNNIVYNNNFINNSIQATDNGINLWNATYPIGGNYWDDYIGVDLYSGVNQDILGSDGIGDTPYIFPTGIDYYPIVNLISYLQPLADAGEDINIIKGGMLFDGTGSSDDMNYTWIFIYNDEVQILYGETPTFTFDIKGVYTVSLTVKNGIGVEDTDEVTITIRTMFDVISNTLFVLFICILFLLILIKVLKSLNNEFNKV